MPYSIVKVWEVSITRSMSVLTETLREHSVLHPGTQVVEKPNILSDYQ